MSEQKARDAVIVRTSIIGILANVILASFKAFVGIFTNSIAVTLDAVNNLSDALSSVVTIIGAKLAAKKPTREHPLGYGRIEYLSALIVAGIVLYAGITAAIESVKAIISPQAPAYTSVALIIIAAAIVVKFVLGRFVSAQGRKVQSGALMASGADASFDAALSASVLASALIYLASGISLEAYVGAVISVVIIKAGIDMIKETVDELLGVRIDTALSRHIKSIISAHPEVHGVYDLILNNYGPNKNYGSVHLELDDTVTVAEVDKLTRILEREVYEQTGVLLVGVGVYAHNTHANKAAELEARVRSLISSYDWVVSMHGFYLDESAQTLRFDAVMSFDIDQEEGVKILTDALTEELPGFKIFIAADVDFSD